MSFFVTFEIIEKKIVNWVKTNCDFNDSAPIVTHFGNTQKLTLLKFFLGLTKQPVTYLVKFYLKNISNQFEVNGDY